jgi:hypothetical protein
MCFDVESIGLHGDAFAVGYVVVDKDRIVHDEQMFSCPRELCDGQISDLKWVNENIPPLEISHTTLIEMRNAFWEKWKYWKSKGALLVTDCGWPVESNFLSACIKDNLDRAWEGPLPMLDISSLLFMTGKDPIATRKRLSDELPIHNPLSDAKQSIRILLDLMSNPSLVS